MFEDILALNEIVTNFALEILKAKSILTTSSDCSLSESYINLRDMSM